MLEQKYDGKTYLEYAREAVEKIRKVSQVICGSDMPESGSLLGDANYCIYIKIQIVMTSIVVKEIGDDDLNDLATQIMYAEESEIDSILKEYVSPSNK